MSDSEYISESENISESESEEKIKKSPIRKKTDEEIKNKNEELKRNIEELKRLIEYKKRPEIRELEKRISKEEILRNQEDTRNYNTVEEYKEGLRKRAENMKITKIKRGKYKKHKDIKYIFITINPMECTVNDIYDIIKKLEKMKNLKIESYVFEQRGETMDDMGIGKHIHILAKKECAISEFKRRIMSALKKTKLIKDENKINIINVTDKEGIEHYMQGKKSPEKFKKMKITRRWREIYGMHHIYHKTAISEYQWCDIEIKKIEAEKVTRGEDIYIVVEINNKKVSIKLNDYI